MRLGRSGAAALAATLLLGAVACQQADLSLPEAEEVQAYYATARPLSVEMNGNVAVVTVFQDPEQLRQGGALWARVGPYVFLFTEATRDLIEDHPGVAGVRVVTRAPGGAEVARALLLRDALNGLTWRRALNIAGVARRDGTQRLSLLEDLVDWGEEHTVFEYSETYVPKQ